SSKRAYSEASPMSAGLFTACPRCGRRTAIPVRLCTECGFVVGSYRPPGVLSTLILLGGIALVAFFTWQRFFSTQPPFVGAWANQRVEFKFAADGGLATDCLFRPDGTFEERSKPLSGRWSAIGPLLRFEFDSKPSSEPREAEWSVS